MQEDRRKALFIDDNSKTVIFSDFTEDNIHLPDAFWVPALGYTRNSDNFDGHVYVSGATGAGKSYIICKMVQNDKLRRMCVLFTDLHKDDPSLSKIDYVRFDPNTKYNWDWLAEHQQNKIMIFDDVQYNEDVLKYRDTMLEKGRHMNTVVICVNHRLQDHYRTLVPLNDARFIVMFPATNKSNVKRYLDSELGMDKKDLNKLLSLASKEGRQLILHKFHPVTVATKESITRI